MTSPRLPTASGSSTVSTASRSSTGPSSELPEAPTWIHSGVTSDCLTLSLPQGLDRQRLDGWRHQFFELGEGEEQGYHRIGEPRGSWEPPDTTTVRGRPGS